MIFQKLFEHPIWLKLIGDEKEFPKEEHRAFHAMCIFTLLVLCVLLPFNLLMKLYDVSLLVFALIVFQLTLYYIGRFRKKVAIGMNIYAAISYLTLVITYFLNSGADGPVLYLFFLTLMLLVTFTDKRLHPVWISLHIIVGTGLLYTEYYYPHTVKDVYPVLSFRFLDLASTYIITTLLILLLTKYLRNSHQREKVQVMEKNAQLEEMHREKDRMFSIISHDLKKPLDSIISYLQLVGMYDFDETERKSLEERLLTLSRHTSDLLANLLSWSKVQMQGGNTRLAPEKLIDIVDKELAQQLLIADKKSISLLHDINPELMVMADNDLLQLVIRNLVSNAIKFTPTGGQVRVTAQEQNGRCVICVQDSGIGFSDEFKDKIFTVTKHARPGTSNEKGTGIGLFLCQQSVELQKGSMWYESKPGAGTRFFISLPLPIAS